MYLTKRKGTKVHSQTKSSKYARSSAQQLRASRTAAHFPIVPRTSKRGAKRCAYHAGEAKQVLSSKDDSRQAHYRARAPRPARRRWRRSVRAGVYVGRASRLRRPRVARRSPRPHAVPLLRRHRARRRPRRRRPRRPCRAGAPRREIQRFAFKTRDIANWRKSGAASAPYWLRYGIPVDRTPSRRFARGPATRGLPAGCPGAPSNT